MKGIMVTSDDCTPCVEMKKQFADLIETGEMREVNFERDEDEAMMLITKYGAEVPSLLILSDHGDLIIATSIEEDETPPPNSP